jgi:hypothetical protein
MGFSFYFMYAFFETTRKGVITTFSKCQDYQAVSTNFKGEEK